MFVRVNFRKSKSIILMLKMLKELFCFINIRAIFFWKTSTICIL